MFHKLVPAWETLLGMSGQMGAKEVGRSIETMTTFPDPPPGFRSMADAPDQHGTVVILAHQDSVHDEKGQFDFDVMLARRSWIIHTADFVPLRCDHDDSGDVNHGAVAYPIGWLPLPRGEGAPSEGGRGMSMKLSKLGDVSESADRLEDVRKWIKMLARSDAEVTLAGPHDIVASQETVNREFSAPLMEAMKAYFVELEAEIVKDLVALGVEVDEVGGSGAGEG